MEFISTVYECGPPSHLQEVIPFEIGISIWIWRDDKISDVWTSLLPLIPCTRSNECKVKVSTEGLASMMITRWSKITFTCLSLMNLTEIRQEVRWGESWSNSSQRKCQWSPHNSLKPLNSERGRENPLHTTMRPLPKHPQEHFSLPKVVLSPLIPCL